MWCVSPNRFNGNYNLNPKDRGIYRKLSKSNNLSLALFSKSNNLSLALLSKSNNLTSHFTNLVTVVAVFCGSNIWRSFVLSLSNVLLTSCNWEMKVGYVIVMGKWGGGGVRA
eukprot:sb/3477069/